jgi:hypothetical protein
MLLISTRMVCWRLFVFGFIKLTDMAPLAIAYEKGFFEDEGLYVTLEPQANWKVLLDGVITGAARWRPHAGRASRSLPPSASAPRPTHRHALQHGSQRQRHHRLQRGLAGDEADASGRRRRQASATRSRPRRCGR